MEKRMKSQKMAAIQQAEAKNKQVEQLTKMRACIAERELQLEQLKVKQASIIKQIIDADTLLLERSTKIAFSANTSQLDRDIRLSRLLLPAELDDQAQIDTMKIAGIREIETVITIEDQVKAIKDKKKQIMDELQPRLTGNLIKYMAKKAGMLRMMSKLKADSQLYTSHQRVLLKQFLDELRQGSRELESLCLQQQSKLSDYELCETKLDESVCNLLIFHKPN